MNLHRLSQRLMLAGALFLPTFACLAQPIVVLTEKSLGHEIVKLRVTTPSAFALGRESISIENNKLTVTLLSFPAPPSSGPLPPYGDLPATSCFVTLGSLPPGSYSADVVLLDRNTAVLTSVGTAEFSVADNRARPVSMRLSDGQMEQRLGTPR